MEKGQHDLFADYPDLVDVDTLCKMLGGINKKLAYHLLASGIIYSIRIGRAYRIPKSSVIEYVFGEGTPRMS